jgi:hypothetical protein
VRHARSLPHASWHTVVLGGMVGSYLSAPQAGAPGAGTVGARVLAAVAGAAPAALSVFRARRLAIELADRYTMSSVH